MGSSIFSETNLWIGGLTSIGGLLDYSIVIVLWHGKPFNWWALLLYMAIAAVAGVIAFTVSWYCITQSVMWCYVLSFVAGLLNRRFLDRGDKIITKVLFGQIIG